MDLHHFDSLTRILTNERSRRRALALLGSMLATPLFDANLVIAKKKKKKVTLCHEGQTLSVSKKAKKGHLKHGDTLGACAAPPPPPPPLPPPPPAATCDDEVKNGSESDVDCGGSCQRCENGKTCNGRNDCDGSFCANGTCQECANLEQCGTHTDGSQCVCEQTIGGPKTCNVGGSAAAEPPTCEQCPVGMHCILEGPPAFCVKPCGAA